MYFDHLTRHKCKNEHVKWIKERAADAGSVWLCLGRKSKPNIDGVKWFTKTAHIWKKKKLHANI